MEPLASSSAAVWAAPASRSPMATTTPSRARARAMAWPMPRAPPVTTATLPLRERGVLDIPSIMATDEKPVAEVERRTREQAGMTLRPCTGFQIGGKRPQPALAHRRIQLGQARNGLHGIGIEVGVRAPPVGADEPVRTVV